MTSPYRTAARHANHLLPVEYNRFMDTFRIARVRAAGDSVDPMYAEFMKALDADDSVTVAGIIEGIASHRAASAGPDEYFPGPSVPNQRSTRLTPKEAVYLTDAANGLSAIESAARNGVGIETVKTTLAKARRRLGASNTTQAAATAVQLRLIQVSPVRKEFTR